MHARTTGRAPTPPSPPFEELIHPEDEFARIVGETEIENGRDLKVMRRMLAQVAAADGRLDADERRFFAAFANTDEDALEFLAGEPPLAPRDLERTPPALREPLLLFCLAIAYADGQYTPAERAAVEAFRHAFAVPETHMAHLEWVVKAWYLTTHLQRLYGMGRPDDAAYADFQRLARRIGVPDSPLERLENRFLARHHWEDRRARRTRVGAA